MKVLTQLGGSWPDRVRQAAGEVVGDVEVVEVPGEGEPPDGLSGDVVFTWGWPNTADVARSAGAGWVQLAGTGVDRVELGAFTGLTLTCSRGVGGVPIAEFVLASILAFEKRMPEVWIDGPERWTGDLRLGELTGKVAGIVGLGGIGVEVARRALAFDMHVVAARRSERPAPLAGVELVASLDDVLAVADHLVLTVPLTDTTRHLLDERALALVKPGVHVVNIARGGLVDDDALVRALDDGRVAGASLDVADPEPPPAGHPFYTHPRVRLSPHISWSSPLHRGRVIDYFTANLRRFTAGEPLAGVVTEDGY